MSKADLQKQLFKRNGLEKFLAPRVFDEDDGFYLLDENVIGFGFITTPLVYAGENTASDMTTFLNGWIPDNAVISFSIYASEDIQRFAKGLKVRANMRDRDNPTVGELLNDLAAERSEFLSRKSIEPIEVLNNTKAKKTHAYVTVSIPMTPKQLTDEMVEKLQSFKNKLQINLKQTGMSPQELKPQELIHITSTILNTADSSEWRNGDVREYDEGVFIADQIADPETKMERETDDVFWVGSPTKKRYVKVLSCTRFPEHKSITDSFMYFINPLDKSKGIFDNCIIHSSLFIPPKKKSSKEITRARAWADNQRGVSKWRPVLGKIADSMDVLFQSISADNRPVYVSFSAATFGYSKNQVNESAERLKAYYATPGMNLKMAEETIIAPGIFFSMLPFGADPNPDVISMMGRHVKMSALEAPHIVPVCSEWTGNGDPVLQPVSRGGELMGIDLWGSDTNFNGLVSAASGSGKSVFGQTLVLNYLSLENALVYIIDIGDSYKKICNQVEGNYYDFEEAGVVNFSPFSAVSDIDEDLDLVAGVFEVMVSQKNPLSDYEFQVLKNAIRQAYVDKAQDAIVDDVEALLLAQYEKEQDRAIYELAVRLREFTSKGSYKKFFTGDKKVDFGSSQLNVFELSKLDSQETLQAVILFMVLSEIKKRVFKDMSDPEKRARKKLIIVDEGWKLISRGDKAIREFYRTFRKANASIVLITQNMIDVINEGGEVARTMIDNSANKIFLGMESATVGALRESGLIDLSPFEWEILSTIKTEKGHYSELFFMTDRGRGVGRLINSRYMGLVTTTDASESAMIERVRKQLGENATLEEAIRHIVAQEEMQQGRAA